MHALARCLIAAAFAFAPPAWAQAWPAKPIRLIVNAAAGAGPDAVARIYAPRLGEALGQPIVIENRQGAAGSGSIGIEGVARSAPDGYTLLNAPGSTIVLGPNLYKYDVDVARDLDPVAPTVRAALAALGNEAVTASPEAFSALMHRDREHFAAVLREANIRID